MTGSSNKPVRAFIAARPNDAVRTELIRVQGELKKQLAASDLRIKWTDPEIFHITLLFLGDIPAAGVNTVLEEIVSEAQQFPVIETFLGEAGYFSKPRVIQVGLKIPQDLFRLQGALAAALGVEPGHFHAHFTIGRVKNGRPDPEFFQTLEKTVIEPLPFRITSLELMRSDLLPDGARHIVIGSAPLAK